MLRIDRHLRPLIMGLIAFASVLASHYVAYYLAAPDPHYRDALLHSTGHRYFVYLAGALLGVFAAAASVWLRSEVESRVSRRAGFRYAFVRLLVLQAGGFFALEVSERMLFGDGISLLLSDFPLMAGLVLQLIVAVVGALSLILVVRAVERLLRRAGKKRRTHAPLGSAPLPRIARLDSAILSGGAAPRAPPLPA